MAVNSLLGKEGRREGECISLWRACSDTPFFPRGTKDWISLGNLSSGSQQAWAGLSSGLLPVAGIISSPILYEAEVPAGQGATHRPFLPGWAGVAGGEGSPGPGERRWEPDL